MKVSKETKHKFGFETKDHVPYSFSIVADSEKDARAILTDHLSQCLDQIEVADRKEKEAESAGGDKKTAAHGQPPA